MSSSVNKVILIGHVGQAPTLNKGKGDKTIAKFSLATNEKYKDSKGALVSKVYWHNIIVMNQGIVKFASKYLDKGSRVYLEGSLESRTWVNEKDQKQYFTEVVLKGYDCKLVILDSKKEENKADEYFPDDFI